MHTAATPSALRRARRRGFTLIELLVVLVVISVLAIVALPSFMDQWRKGRRAEAVTELYRASQAEERHRASNNAYSSNLGTLGAAPLNLVQSVAAVTTYTMTSGLYTISVDNTLTTASRYVFTATAAGSMTNDTNCRRLVLDMGDPGPVATPNPPGTIFYRSFNSGGTENLGAANNRCWNRG